ncbi:group II intron maturase-specific domain-containing protein [Algoriphagus halophytocola]|uniref:group II intron maturase-specific domain-containing protein n=1 Tax=Algoriphagus halophytocola TaxID=2991499 RepID=UPI0037BF2665
MSRKSKVRINGELRKLNFHNKTQRGIQDLATMLNPKIRGWVNQTCSITGNWGTN